MTDSLDTSTATTSFNAPFNFSAETRVLFQGDSITDCGRNKNDDRSPEIDTLGRDLGRGYAMMVAAQLQLAYPGVTVQNLGISGNRIVDLYARAQEHVWNHNPDLISILIGVNDTWHGFKRSAGIPIPRFERIYRQLLTETREHLPEVTFVLCHPFVLPCGEVGEGWRAEVDQRREVITQLAKEFGAYIVPFQTAFDQAQDTASAPHWAADGVHPSPAGHTLMAREWLKVVYGNTSI